MIGKQRGEGWKEGRDKKRRRYNQSTKIEKPRDDRLRDSQDKKRWMNNQRSKILYIQLPLLSEMDEADNRFLAENINKRFSPLFCVYHKLVFTQWSPAWITSLSMASWASCFLRYVCLPLATCLPGQVQLLGLQCYHGRWCVRLAWATKVRRMPVIGCQSTTTIVATQWKCHFILFPKSTIINEAGDVMMVREG